MLYLVYIEIPVEEGNRLDFEGRGPGPAKMFEGMMGRYKIEAMYAEAGTRNYFIVADLNEDQMLELMLVASKLMGTYPQFTPLVPVAAAAVDTLEKAIEEVKKLAGL